MCCLFFLFNGKNRIELRSERFWNCEQCGAIPKFSAREGGKSESRRRRRRKQDVFDCRASILLGAINNNFETALVRCCFFVLNETPGIELRKERLQKGEQCAAFLLSNYPNRLKYDIIVSMNKNGNEENPALLESYDELCGLLLKIKDKNELKSVFNCLFTPNERRDFAERWQVVKELKAGTTQREIARKYNMSLCKITRGSKELQKSGSGFLRLLELLKD